MSQHILDAVYKRSSQVASKFLKEAVSEHVFTVGSSEGALYNFGVGLVAAKIKISLSDSIEFFSVAYE